jgi:putative component of toxin-antitoxin plasmid stabilization module
MYQYIYYTRNNGRQPAVIFRDKQPVNIRADIDAKVRKLRENGVDVLINTAMVDWLGPKALYELRNRELGWRIAFYFDNEINTFVLLCGWKKQRNLQPSDIEKARRYLTEYLSGRN